MRMGLNGTGCAGPNHINNVGGVALFPIFCALPVDNLGDTVGIVGGARKRDLRHVLIGLSQLEYPRRGDLDSRFKTVRKDAWRGSAGQSGQSPLP
jgi:hypothetical protein